MFKLKNIEKDIKTFVTKDEGVLKIKGEDLYYNNEFIDNNVEYYIYSLFRGKPIYVSNGSTIYNKNKIEAIIHIHNSVQTYSLYSRHVNFNTLTQEYLIVDNNTFSIERSLGRYSILSLSVLVNNLAIIVYNSLITITDLNTQSHITKEINFQIDKVLCVFEENLFLACSSRTIVCISLQTGEIIQTWRELPNINKGSKIEGVIPEPKNFVLDKENELLVGRGINTIITIDLKTNNISFVSIDEELKRHNIFALKGISKDAFNSTHLFLTGMMHQTPEDTKFSYDCLFALNRETLQIDWQYNFEEESLGTHKPVLSGNKLYQLDNNKTLHIFEKEEHIN